jgi:uncharacterized OB-fold protein
MTSQEQTATACQHCGALVFPETKQCPQCGKFPIKLHKCRYCKTISPPEADRCENCGRIFFPGEDFL